MLTVKIKDLWQQAIDCIDYGIGCGSSVEQRKFIENKDASISRELAERRRGIYPGQPGSSFSRAPSN